MSNDTPTLSHGTNFYSLIFKEFMNLLCNIMQEAKNCPKTRCFLRVRGPATAGLPTSMEQFFKALISKV